MKHHLLVKILSILSLSISIYAPNINALTMKQFSEICHSSPKECSNHPVFQAYIGGALDLLATLDERTEYLEKVYCKEPRELFDVPAIIKFMMQQSEEYSQENAMLVLVRYIEVHGGCDSE